MSHPSAPRSAEARTQPGIENTAVIGAGVMGASIAAQIANAGVPVLLLDIVPPEAGRRSQIAEAALEKLAKADPPALMRKANARLITPGNVEDHWQALAGVDWVVEAVIEDLAIKRALFEKLDAICREDTLISSNTSTLPLRLLSKGMPERFARRFMITHFFNPPRYMRLLELVESPQLRPDLAETIRRFADVRLGKTCVLCKDTPGFIANRVSSYWLQCGLLEALELGLTVEEADAALGVLFGLPKTGLFGLLDLVGLDLLPHVIDFLNQALPPEDAFHRVGQLPERVQRMIAQGLTGRKGKGGFYRLAQVEGRRVKQALDLNSGEYRASEKVHLTGLQSPEDLRAWLAGADKTGRYGWRVLAATLAYAAGLLPEIADDPSAVDAAMRLGYHWRQGPFELLDSLGVDWFVERLKTENLGIPPLLQTPRPLYQADAQGISCADLAGGYRPALRTEGLLSLADIKRKGPPVLANPSASLWDLGDGAACLEFHSKLNTLGEGTMALLRQSLDAVLEGFAALVIYNEGEHFSAGASLDLLVKAIHGQDWAWIEQILAEGQQAHQALKYAPFPAVGAPSGMALGGGLEILLHCDALQAHAELYAGLVETGVGLVPGWGGCKEYLGRQLDLRRRPGGPLPALFKAFETVGMAKVTQSAFEAQDWLILAKTDGITMNRDRLLAEAKAKALALVPGYAPPKPHEYRLPGKTGGCAADMAIRALRLAGKITAYDAEVSRQLAYILSGGSCDITQPLGEDDMLALEREVFLHLTKQPGTLQRLEHMLATGKPLRN